MTLQHKASVLHTGGAFCDWQLPFRAHCLPHHPRPGPLDREPGTRSTGHVPLRAAMKSGGGQAACERTSAQPGSDSMAGTATGQLSACARAWERNIAQLAQHLGLAEMGEPEIFAAPSRGTGTGGVDVSP